uniref:OVATE domain-containing protein n=1 Tax=Aegilops tauschii TaxID=37682 RepID=M8B7Y5_AEGTA
MASAHKALRGRWTLPVDPRNPSGGPGRFSTIKIIIPSSFVTAQQVARQDNVAEQSAAAMHFFSGRSKLRQKSGGGKNQADASTAAKAKHKDGRCRALCCGASRLSVSSSASCSSLDAPDTTRGRMSDIAHGMVEARLQSMGDAASVDGRSSATRRGTEPADQRRRWPRMAEPAELRALLNCYVSVNAREHRAAILDAFHEVCTGLFACKG